MNTPFHQALDLANEAIQVVLATPVEKYPYARGLDHITDHSEFGSRIQQYALNLFNRWASEMGYL